MEEDVEIQPSASDPISVKVLASFFLCDSRGSATAQAIHKEKFNVPIHANHKQLYDFTKHMVRYADLKRIASTKGLGQNPEITIARVKKNQTGAGVDVFSIHTQEAWENEFPFFMTGTGMLQGT